ncbi:hypothetical protein BH24ACT4_BH24ACT4_07140 [soil metagenome]
MGAASPRRVPRFGPETWAEVDGREWSLWDLWFCVVAVLDHDGDLGALADRFVDRLRSHEMHERDVNEAKLSHLTDLQRRLAESGLTPADLASAEAIADKTITQRARNKVTGRINLEHRARTPAMIDTPRHVLAHRARYGHWSDFPSDPTRFFEKFRPTVVRKDFVTKGKTFAFGERMEKRLADLDGPRRTLPDRLALYRAFHTAGLELADAADDSYGVIGEVRTAAWLTYLAIDWRSAAIDPDAYWRDLCELRLWDPYGLAYQNETAWFGSASQDDVDRVEAILLDLEAEHRAVILDYEAEEAAVAIADLYVASGARDRYESAALRLGSQSWRSIVAMAESQLKERDRSGAVAVFRAADQPGWHRDFLRGKCLAMTGVDLAGEEQPER